jgi:polyisoprenyl-teichoic acid--peptidoglycan teichoic acid transferase
MPDEKKPYRRYRGGRVKGKVPLQRHLASESARGSRPDPTQGGPGGRRRRLRWLGWIRWKLVFFLVLPTILLLVAAWGLATYLAFAHGISSANSLVPASVRQQLAKQGGLLATTPTTIAAFGTDGGETGRAGSRHSDSIMLIRTDPGRHRLAYLSIPRDLRVEIPGYGANKIDAAFQYGGPTLALQTVKQLTGLDVNHVMFVDFAHFKELIDAVGGIDINVKNAILSNKFDCPYATVARCNAWPGWRFAKGPQHMNGTRALIFSRIRENKLNPAETDFDRQARQQQVIQATAAKLTGFWSAVELPFTGSKIVRPLATDLSAWQLLQLGWAYFRSNSSQALHCRLGGSPESVGGQSVIVGSEDNAATISMFLGLSAPLPPPKGLPYAPGCTVGAS